MKISDKKWEFTTDDLMGGGGNRPLAPLYSYATGDISDCSPSEVVHCIPSLRSLSKQIGVIDNDILYKIKSFIHTKQG